MYSIFNEIKQIRGSGDLKLTLIFGNIQKHDVIAKPVIQLIVR